MGAENNKREARECSWEKEWGVITTCTHTRHIAALLSRGMPKPRATGRAHNRLQNCLNIQILEIPLVPVFMHIFICFSKFESSWFQLISNKILVQNFNGLLLLLQIVTCSAAYKGACLCGKANLTTLIVLQIWYKMWSKSHMLVALMEVHSHMDFYTIMEMFESYDIQKC